ncbi:MAG: serine/threonine protein kinase, partial [Deltaproteobacteria bacterium]|nr:serine/threonine protein kinase [Deltaproteobacteria bacterium]
MEQLGRYIIQEEIGKGGMGIVYRAYDPEIDRKLALKVLRADMAEDEEIVQRFLREAKAAGRLAHPNIVTVYDVGEDGGMPFIAMEFLSGISLEEMIKQGPLPLRDALRFSGQIAHALHYAHREGVVHRDIKPSNIIVGGDGQVKITDFGIARVQDISSSEQTRTGQILGTPTYMSPEQVQGKKVNGSADLFSLGVILYEMISGERP